MNIDLFLELRNLLLKEDLKATIYIPNIFILSCNKSAISSIFFTNIHKQSWIKELLKQK